MIGLLLSCQCAVSSLGLSPCVEPDAAAAVAIGLVHANLPEAKVPPRDPSAGVAAAGAASRQGGGPSSRSEKAQVSSSTTCDERGCQFAPRAAPPRRFFGKRR